jgi:hypothetical protein
MKVSRVGAQARQGCGWQLIDPRLNGGYAIFLERVGQKPRIDSCRFGFSFLEKLLEHRDHAFRADPGPHDIIEAFLISLGLVLPAESGEYSASSNIDRCIGDPTIADAGEHARERDSHVRALLLLHLLHSVAPHHVADFVAENAGDLIHFVGALDEPAIHVDKASGNRERIHFLAVDDEKVPVEIFSASEAGDRVAEDVDVAIKLGILDDR